jgi:hypothetical protein
MTRYSGSGWHKQSLRHSRARKTGHAGGEYSVRGHFRNKGKKNEVWIQYHKATKKHYGKEQEPLMEWMDDIPKEEIEFRMEEAKENGYTKTEEQIRNEIWQNSDYWDDQWEYMTEYLTEKMQLKTKGLKNPEYWHAEVSNFGWRSQSGESNFKAENGKELLQKILPKTDCHFRIYDDGKRGFKIQNYHHDSPTGNEWYHIRPMNQKEVK